MPHLMPVSTPSHSRSWSPFSPGGCALSSISRSLSAAFGNSSSPQTEHPGARGRTAGQGHDPQTGLSMSTVNACRVSSLAGFHMFPETGKLKTQHSSSWATMCFGKSALFYMHSLVYTLSTWTRVCKRIGCHLTVYVGPCIIISRARGEAL